MTKRMKKVPTMVSPAVARPGAQYTCFGDGLCCSDIHVIGPLTKPEYVQVRKYRKDSAGYSDDQEEYMMLTAADGRCRLLLSDNRCSMHADLGEASKPEGCRRFPLGLVGTPIGGRITTEHRCTCRTMGARPEINVESALRSVTNDAGELESDRDISVVPIERKEKVSFDEWLKIEAEVFARLQNGEAPEVVLDAKPFPRLRRGSWKSNATEMLEGKDGTQFGFAVAWVGEVIMHLVHNTELRPPVRPWRAAFDRAEKRAVQVRTADEVFADWVMDEIWSLKWAEEHDWRTCRKELTTRLAIGRAIVARMVADGAREDRAAAEALTILELTGESEFWEDVKDAIYA